MKKNSIFCLKSKLERATNSKTQDKRLDMHAYYDNKKNGKVEFACYEPVKPSWICQYTYSNIITKYASMLVCSMLWRMNLAKASGICQYTICFEAWTVSKQVDYISIQCALKNELVQSKVEHYSMLLSMNLFNATNMPVYSMLWIMNLSKANGICQYTVCIEAWTFFFKSGIWQYTVSFEEWTCPKKVEMEYARIQYALKHVAF